MSELMMSKLTGLLRFSVPGARVSIQRLPDCGGIDLMLVDPGSIKSRYTADEITTIMSRPAYWSLCWASGLVLARYLLEHPLLVRGKQVIDFGAGSGIVAIAAAKAGATGVVACDIDSEALQAVSVNAALNAVEIERVGSLKSIQGTADLLIAADVLYDRANLSLLNDFCQYADQVLVADSRIKNFSVPPYVALESIEGRTFPDLDEFDEFGRVNLYSAGLPVQLSEKRISG